MIFWNSSFVFLCFFWDLYVLACWCLWKNNVAFRCFCWDCSSFIACSSRSGRRCWLHFEKRQPRFLIFLYFQKRFFSFLFCVIFHLHLLHFENRQSRFLLFSFSFVFSKTSFFSSIFCFLFHLLLSHFEKRHPLSSLFFIFLFSINNDFFQGPLLTAAFSNGYQWGVFKIFGQQIGEKLLISPE